MVKNSQLEIIKSEVVKKMSNGNNRSIHNTEHIERVAVNATKIVKKLNIKNKIDFNLLIACCYLHDLTFADNKESIKTYIYEGKMVEKPARKILNKAKINSDDTKTILNAIKNHPHSFPFKRLNKNNDIYSKILQDSDTLDLFNEQRLSQIIENVVITNSLKNIYLKFGKKYLIHFLNYPKIYKYFYDNRNNKFMNYYNKISAGLAYKNEDWYLKRYEDRFIAYALPRIPNYIETYHLTYLTLIWSVFMLIFAFLSISNIYWFWGVSLMIFFQHITDMLDGNLGRAKNTGLILWGFFMDHLLDYVFLFALITSYLLISPGQNYMFYILYFIGGLLMFAGTLGASLTDKMTISYKKVGTSEFRYIIIFLNILLIHISTSLLYFSFLFILLFTILSIVKIYSLQKELWRMDMAAKNNNPN